MNQQAYEAGKAAYQQGDWNGAVALLHQAIDATEANGAAEHMLGNAYMKLGRYAEAADAYGKALADASYGKVGALSCNRGRAYLAAGQPDEAIASLNAAVQDQSYAKAYKAYVALGEAYRMKNDVRDAGIAFRNAAIDESNPDPSFSLRELGACFIALHRPVDAVEAYRTALDFATPMENQNAIYSELGMAYVAANRMSEAVDAFAHATADGTYILPTDMQIAYDSAKRAVASTQANNPSETDALLAAAGYGTSQDTFDPLDPLGQSGEFMPSPEKTGFFSVSEQDLVEADKKERKVRRKKKHTGLKVFLVLLIVVVVVGGVGAYAYWRGYGWPTQETVITSLFNSKTSGDDPASFMAPSLSDSERAAIEDILPSGATISVDGLDKSMDSSTARVTATLSSGTTQTYTVTLVRDGIGWRVSSLQLSYDSVSSNS